MPEKPNILLILTDQQSAIMMGCDGNPYVKTPAMDRLAAEGVKFDRAYCSNPVCIPSRFSLFTGRMPSYIGQRSNEWRNLMPLPENIVPEGVGHRLREAGYDTVYGGKQHLPGFRAEDIGFDYVTDDERDELSRVSVEFLKQDHDKPFCFVASFINPHDICHMAIRDFPQQELDFILLEKCKTEQAELDKALERPEGVSEEDFFASHCPPAPANIEPQDGEVKAISWLQNLRHFKRDARAKYTDRQWRLHRWAYARLTERVDAQIAPLLGALDETGLAESTAVIFTSDHGDMDGHHRMEHKSVFYDESARVPMLARMPGGKAGIVDSEHIISNGLDLVPTICDLAGLSAPADLAGRSIVPLLRDGDPFHVWPAWRPIESEIGRCVVDGRYRYALYDVAGIEEELVDLQEDPGEMKNLAADSAYRQTLVKMRQRFKGSFPEVGVP